MDLQSGKGKPEALRYRKAWSRIIDNEHRLGYSLDENKNLVIISCKGHYEDYELNCKIKVDFWVNLKSLKHITIKRYNVNRIYNC